MKEARCVDDVDFAIKLSKSRTGSLVEHIPDQEFALERVSIPEKIVAQIDEFGPQFCPEDVLAGCSIGNELSNVLRKTAADV